MSFDAALATALQPLRDELADLRRRVEVAERDLKRPVYDAAQLQEDLGFSQHEAYNILRGYGVLLHGRRRIAATDLTRVYSRDSDTSAPSGAYAAQSNSPQS